MTSSPTPRRSWRCECGDLNPDYESGCYRCGAGRPEDLRTRLDYVMQSRGVEAKVGFYGALLDDLVTACKASR